MITSLELGIFFIDFPFLPRLFSTPFQTGATKRPLSGPFLYKQVGESYRCELVHSILRLEYISFLAIDNIDPFYQASVLSRGLIAELQGELYVASPLKKQHFRLKDGVCLENTDFSVTAFDVRVTDGRIELKPKE